MNLSLKTRLLRRGEAIAQAGLTLKNIAVDLDETIWEWSLPLLPQPWLLGYHREVVFVRDPLIWLLQGIGGGPLNAWTAGYGVRVDRICEQHTDLATLLALDPKSGDEAEKHPTIVTRRDFVSAVEKQPSLIPDPVGSWISQKIPGAPTLAGKATVDQARVLFDDKESNCRRFVEAGEGRSAIWLCKTERAWRASLPLLRVQPPKAQRWADGIAEALEAIANGQTGLYPVMPVKSEHLIEGVTVRLPHTAGYRDWLRPRRVLRTILKKEQRRRESIPPPPPSHTTES